MHGSDKGARRIERSDGFTLLVETGLPDGYVCELGRNALLGSIKPTAGFARLRVEALAYSHSLLCPGVRAADVATAHDAFMPSYGLMPERRLYAHG